ncbi:GNAT family N-acetyltransferase [Sphingomonas sp. BIUV-7]|uniref:GNAT family N-acetyltransferase n=1 Tax=Sphingomonas natans TaxID=3063330 RepID=A0ABT8YBK7_9SPHN|nr:GNAT family N-acetyltransferase [Sphingomonas sp. BIUV-7]MDO6415731.1 GNAT family N-acetyltransferase [Sphingomonas sp. BIUV-7]
MALTPVADGELAAIVTSLEMRERPKPRPLPASPFRLVRWASPPPERYRTLFTRIGTPWLWFSRLLLDDAALTAIIDDPAVEVYAVTDRAGIEIGILELDFRVAGECEIGFFGLITELSGKGHGRWLMAETLARAWRPGIGRVWVHTCTLDHPSALNFYQRQGFVAFARAVEIFADPRLLGVLPREAGPHAPVLDQPRPTR